MTGCAHDPTYQIENEANGGTGCPLCNSLRPGYIAKPHVIIDAAKAQGDEKAAAYEDWRHDVSAETQEMIDMTARIVAETEPIEY
jgi:hypothetical protein